MDVRQTCVCSAVHGGAIMGGGTGPFSRFLRPSSSGSCVSCLSCPAVSSCWILCDNSTYTHERLRSTHGRTPCSRLAVQAASPLTTLESRLRLPRFLEPPPESRRSQRQYSRQVFLPRSSSVFLSLLPFPSYPPSGRPCCGISSLPSQARPVFAYHLYPASPSRLQASQPSTHQTYTTA